MAPFCSMLVACKLENGSAPVEQTPAQQKISCEFGYLSATCRSARARFLSPIDGANHNARIVPRLRCRIPDATVDQSPASGGVGNRADDFHPQRATSVGEISRPSAFALWDANQLYIRERRAQAMCKR